MGAAVVVAAVAFDVFFVVADFAFVFGLGCGFTVLLGFAAVVPVDAAALLFVLAGFPFPLPTPGVFVFALGGAAAVVVVLDSTALPLGLAFATAAARVVFG